MTAFSVAASGPPASPVAILAKRGALVGAVSAYGIPMLLVEVFSVAALTEGEVASVVGGVPVFFVFSVGAAVIWAILGAAAGAVAGSSSPFFSKRLKPRAARITTGAVEGVIVGIATGVGVGAFLGLSTPSSIVIGFGAALAATGTAAWALRAEHEIRPAITVWLTEWQLGDAGYDVRVGDSVEWTLSAPDSEWMDQVFDGGSSVMAQVDHYREDDVETTPLVGTVSGLQAVMPLYAYARDGEARSERFPVRGSTALTDVDSTERRVGLIRPNGVIGFVATVTSQHVS